MEKREGESADKKDKKRKKSETYWVVICKHRKEVKTKRRKERIVWFLNKDDKEMAGWVGDSYYNVGFFFFFF